MQKFVMPVKKNLKINMLKIKKYCKARDHCHYAVEYRSAASSICHLKYNIPKEIRIVFTMDLTMIIILS